MPVSRLFEFHNQSTMQSSTISHYSFLKTALAFFMLLFFYGCGGAKQEEALPEISDEFQVYQIDIDKPSVRFSEFVEEVEVMRLEETAESLLDYAFRVSTFEDKLIFPSGREGEVYVYTNTGEFVSKFGYKGDGPGEYPDYNGIFMSGDTVAIYAHGKSALMYYDLAGNHLKTFKFQDQPIHVTPFGKGLALDMTFRPVDDSLQYRLLMLDEKGERKETLLPYEKAVPFPVFSNINSFKPYRDHLTFQPTFHDTIYVLKPRKVAPLFAVDFKGKFLWNDEELYVNGQAAMNLIAERGEVWVFNTYVGERHIYVNYNTSFQDHAVGIIDRATGTFTKLDQSKGPEEEFPITIVSADHDRYLFCVPSTDIGGFLQELAPEQLKFRQGTTLEEIESSENPVLMWVKFKSVDL